MTDQWLVRKLLEQDKKIEALSRGGTGVGHTSIAPGEALTVISEDGEVVLGAGGVDYVDGPTPATPSAPSLKLGFGTIEVTWDGSFADGEDENGIPLVAPIDFDVAEVHCSTDPLEEEWGDDTRRGQIKTREGGTITVGGFDVDDEVFVCLIALAKTGKRSAPSATASLVIEGLDFSQLFNELDAANATIKNAGEILVTEQGTLDEKLTEVDGTLNDLGQDLAAVEDAQAQLNTDLEDVMTSVDGKNTITWNPSAPSKVSNPGKAVGDMWYRTSGNSIIGFWKWDGTDWVTQLLDKTTIPLIDIGGGTFGSLAGSRLTAGSVTADKVLVGSSENLLPMSGVNAGAGVAPHEAVGGRTLSLISSSVSGREYVNALRVQGQTDGTLGTWSDALLLASGGLSGPVGGGKAFPVKVGQSFRADSYLMRSGSEPDGRVIARMTLAWYDYAGNFLSRNTGAEVGGVYTTDNLISVEAMAPVSAAFVRVYVQTDRRGDIILWRCRLLEQKGTVFIEAGGITTPKLAANVLEVGNLKAGTAAIQEAVVNKLWAEAVVAKMVTATEFIGENAILTGAVTAPKITASEELWAKIGEFVKIRAEQIEADAIDGMVITGAKVQSSATNPKSQMSTSGFESFAADGSRTFFADAVTGDVNMTGSFYSNYDGLPRVEINNDDWADIEVVGEDGVPRFVNGSGIRLGSTAMDGVSIFHGSWNTAGGASGQAATFEGPLGKSRLQLLDSGRLEIQSGPSAGTVKSRIGTFANGGAYVISYKEGGGESSRLSVDAFGRGTFSSYGGTNGVVPMGRLAVDETLGAELLSQTTAGTFGARVRAGIDKNVTLQGESVNVNVNDAAGGRFRATAVYNVTSSAGDRVHVNAEGTLFRYLTSSSLRYKQNIVPAEGKPSILDVVPVTWSYKEEVERAEAAKQYLAEHGDGPLPREFDMTEIEPPRLYGAIAEDVHELGLTELVKYDFAGRPDGLDYEKFGVALIPVVRELRDRVTELETKLENS